MVDYLENLMHIVVKTTGQPVTTNLPCIVPMLLQPRQSTSIRVAFWHSARRPWERLGAQRRSLQGGRGTVIRYKIGVKWGPYKWPQINVVNVFFLPYLWGLFHPMYNWFLKQPCRANNSEIHPHFSRKKKQQQQKTCDEIGQTRDTQKNSDHTGLPPTCQPYEVGKFLGGFRRTHGNTLSISSSPPPTHPPKKKDKR